MRSALVVLLCASASACWQDGPPAVDPQPVKTGGPSNGEAPIGSEAGPAEQPSDQGTRGECPPNTSPHPVAASGEALPGELGRVDVQCAMKRIDADVKACSDAKSRGSVITVECRIDEGGAVPWAKTVGTWAGTRVGDCVAKAVSGAVFPVSRTSLTVTYPFKL
jgi:hypothetical protein